MNIGFIGLGSLGTPIALNLVQSGHAVFVYNRTFSKTQPLVEKAAIACNSIASLAAQCSVVFSIVSDDAALKAICEGEAGLVNQLAEGGLHISMSTILPATAREMEDLHSKKKQAYLAAPVFGRPEAAQARKLNFVISGKAAAILQGRPLLQDAGGAGIWDFGTEIQAANTVKLCGNYLIAAALKSIGESIQLASGSGVDAEKMWDFFGQTLFNAPVFNNYSKIVLRQQFEPAAFTAKLGLKDLNLVLAQAASIHQEMSLAKLLKDEMEALVSAGQDQRDWSILALGRP